MDYDTMTLEQLDSACESYYRKLRAVRAQLVDGLPAAQELALRSEAHAYRAHIDVIQRRRTKAMRKEELERSQAVALLRGLSPEEWESLSQMVVAERVEETATVPSPAPANKKG
jgi:hypothetical protein